MDKGRRKTMNDDTTNDPLQEERERIKKLDDPLLTYNIIKEVQKNGVVGEEPTILILINKSTLRLVKNKDPTSDNLIVSDKTGGGKDYVVIKTCKVLIPDKIYFHRTDLSDKVFDYWQPGKWIKEKDGTKKFISESWNGKILHLEDPRDDALNGQSFKVMLSGGTEVTKVIKQHAVDIKIDGKPGIIITSLKTIVDLEGMRRLDSVRIDTTVNQTNEINKHQLLVASGKLEINNDSCLIDALQNNLSKKRVIIPYAVDLFEILPNTLLSRTQTNKLLDFIKSSAVLHQYQRKQIDNSTIEANYFDLAYGWFVFTYLNSNMGIPTNSDEETFIKILIEQNKPLPINELSNLFTIHTKQWIYDNKEKMVTKGLIKIENLYSDDANKRVEHITFGENASLVLKGFKDVLRLVDKEGFKGFKGFKDICICLDQKRAEKRLKPIFTHIFGENPENLENLSIEPFLKPPENHLKTPMTKDNIDIDRYRSNIQRIEEIVGNNHLSMDNIFKRMGENNLVTQQFLEGILNASLKEKGFTSLCKDKDGLFFNGGV